MSNATFHNFSNEAFTGYWNGKSKTFAPGAKVYMPAYLAEHFAKHLANRELIRAGKETYTSPKKPQDVPQFMEVFNKAFIRDDVSDHQNELEAEIASANVTAPSADITVMPAERIDNGPAAAQADIVGPGKEAQIVTGPDEGDDESEFDTGNK